MLSGVLTLLETGHHLHLHSVLYRAGVTSDQMMSFQDAPRFIGRFEI